MDDGRCRVIPNLSVALMLLFGSAAVARAEIRSSFLMLNDPEIHVPPTVNVFAPRLKGLWLEALARPEADMQRLAADAITRGHAAGMRGLEGAIPRLESLLSSARSHPSARLAAARALVELGANDSAATLAGSVGQFGADLRQIIEPALAQWDYQPMRAEWHARLKDPQTGNRELMLAIR